MKMVIRVCVDQYVAFHDFIAENASWLEKPGVCRSQYRFAGGFSRKLRLTLDYTQGCRLGVPGAERG
jgi:hypothetical protein